MSPSYLRDIATKNKCIIQSFENVPYNTILYLVNYGIFSIWNSGTELTTIYFF